MIKRPHITHPGGILLSPHSCSRVSADLKKISEHEQVPIELDAYVKKLTNARRRVMLVNNILQNAQVSLFPVFPMRVGLGDSLNVLVVGLHLHFTHRVVIFCY